VTESTDPLESYDKAVRLFRESSWHVHGPLVSEDLADHTLRARASETAHDVYVFCQTFRGFYERAHAEMRQRLQGFQLEVAARPESGSAPEQWERHMEKWLPPREQADREADERRDGRDATSAFTVGFKALYFFIRAHQDALCGLTMLLLHPLTANPGQYRMGEHLKRDGPVTRFIRQSAPGYEEWFPRWRDARNEVKKGVNFSTYGSWNELGIRFSTFIPEGGGIKIDCSRGGGLSDIVEALDMSSRLHSALRDQAALTADVLRGRSGDKAATP
jgi:hypothetical protein